MHLYLDAGTSPDAPDTPDPGNNGNGNSAGNNGQGNGNSAGNGDGDGNGSINKTSTVIKDFVVDYNTETFEPLMEHEVNGLDYKYVYGNDRLSVDISPIDNSMKLVENGDHVRLYYHMDYLGTADYLTSPVSGKVEAWTHYNEWGLIVHNAVLKCGQRELDLVKRYATHDYDSVLELYYAKARFYDAHDRHFTGVDPILDPSRYDLREYVSNPVQLVQYLYVQNQPLDYVDKNGELPTIALGAVVGAVMGGAKAAVKAFQEKKDLKSALTSVGRSALVGAAAGAAVGVGVGIVASVAGTTLGVGGTLAAKGASRVATSTVIGATISGASTAASSYVQNKRVDLPKTAVSATAGAVVESIIPDASFGMTVAANSVVAAAESVSNSMIDRSRGANITTRKMVSDAAISAGSAALITGLLGKATKSGVIADPLRKKTDSCYINYGMLTSPDSITYHETPTGKDLFRNLAADIGRSTIITEGFRSIVEGVSEAFTPFTCKGKESKSNARNVF